MKTILKTLIVALTLLSGIALAQSYSYSSDVTLYGTFVSPPGETPDGKKINYPALELVVPITVNATLGEEDFEPTEKGVMLLHLVLNEKRMAEFRSLKGRRVSVNGTLFHSDNGNHQTDVLMDVTSISTAR